MDGSAASVVIPELIITRISMKGRCHPKRKIIANIHLQPCELIPKFGAGSVDGLLLKAKGTLLEHKAASTSLEEARQTAKVKVVIPAIRDWVIDHTFPTTLWLVSGAAWYR